MKYGTALCSLYFLLSNCITAMSDFTGKYTLTRILDAQQRPIAIPPEHDFLLEIQENAKDSTQFIFLLKIGNTLRSSFTVNADDSVSFGMVVSTRMFSGQELAALESAVSGILPSCVHMEKGDILLIKGSEGELEFKAATETEA